MTVEVKNVKAKRKERQNQKKVERTRKKISRFLSTVNEQLAWSYAHSIFELYIYSQAVEASRTTAAFTIFLGRSLCVVYICPFNEAVRKFYSMVDLSKLVSK